MHGRVCKAHELTVPLYIKGSDTCDWGFVGMQEPVSCETQRLCCFLIRMEELIPEPVSSS